MRERYSVGVGKSKNRDESYTVTYDGRVINPISAEAFLTYLKGTFGGDVEGEVRSFTRGIKKKVYQEVWLTVKRERFHSLVAEMAHVQPPHIAIASGSDLGEEIQIIYHFTMFYGIRDKAIGVHVKVNLPKNDPVIDTITDILPGALITEREKQEFLGIIVKNIPDPRRCFTSPDMPPGFYPWRKDNDPEVEKSLVKDSTQEGL